MARLVNPVLVAVDKERRQEPSNSAVYRNIAAQYDWTANAVGNVPVRGKRFGEAMVEYQKVLREGGRDARLFADALDSKDPGRIATVRGNAARTVKHEGAALGRVDSYCRAR